MENKKVAPPFLPLYHHTLGSLIFLPESTTLSLSLSPSLPLSLSIYRRWLAMSANQASLLLQKQLKDLCKNPVDGFSAGLVDENNVFQWSVSIMGPPDTL
ncbi:hypothetical protein N665_2475s0003 [Sinapis alba]|nr:hypothetical protein N665_2475s0003 [Sinapis alba]